MLGYSWNSGSGLIHMPKQLYPYFPAHRRLISFSYSLLYYIRHLCIISPTILHIMSFTQLHVEMVDGWGEVS